MRIKKKKPPMVSEVIGELVEGKTYLVPTVRGSLAGKFVEREWPILIGPRHYDVEFFRVHIPHYHLDLRFIDYEDWRTHWGKQLPVGVGRYVDGSLPPIEHKPYRCLQSRVLIHITQIGTEDFCAAFRGKQCTGSAQSGWVCPHKFTWLGNHWADDKGVITCLAHGLKIDAATGMVL